jgi:hypothetical protein
MKNLAEFMANRRLPDEYHDPVYVTPGSPNNRPARARNPPDGRHRQTQQSDQTSSRTAASVLTAQAAEKIAK